MMHLTFPVLAYAFFKFLPNDFLALGLNGLNVPIKRKNVRFNSKSIHPTAMNKDEILPFVTIGMDMERIMLSE